MRPAPSLKRSACRYVHTANCSPSPQCSKNAGDTPRPRLRPARAPLIIKRPQVFCGSARGHKRRRRDYSPRQQVPKDEHAEPALQDEAKMLWKELTSKHDVKAAVFISNKPDNFIAGADIGMLAAKKKAGEEDSLRAVCLSGHAMFDELKGSGVPFVAAIHGACFGGGLEWAMKCDASGIASTSPKTKLGLPEVKLGLLPGWGGTYALPKLVGLTEALPMILQGKEVRPDKAKKIGLVDAVCDPAALEALAVQTAVNSHKAKKNKRRSPGCAGPRKTCLSGATSSSRKLKKQ